GAGLLAGRVEELDVVFVQVQPVAVGDAQGAVDDGRHQAAWQAAAAVPQHHQAEVALGQQGDRAAVTLHRTAVVDDAMPGIVVDAPAYAVAGVLQAGTAPGRTAGL